MLTRKKQLAVLALAAALVTPTISIYAEDEKTNTGNNAEEIVNVTSAIEDKIESGKNYSVDENSAVHIINTDDKPLIIENSTFEIKGPLVQMVNPAESTRVEEEDLQPIYSKFVVEGDVTFKNCTFVFEGEEESNEGAYILIKKGNTEFEDCSITSNAPASLLKVASLAKASMSEGILTSDNAASPAIVLEKESRLELDEMAEVKFENGHESAESGAIVLQYDSEAKSNTLLEIKESPLIIRNDLGYGILGENLDANAGIELQNEEDSSSADKKSDKPKADVMLDDASVAIENTNNTAVADVNITMNDESELDTQNNESGIRIYDLIMEKSKMISSDNTAMGLSILGTAEISDSSVEVKNNDLENTKNTPIDTWIGPEASVEVKNSGNLIQLGNTSIQEGASIKEVNSTLGYTDINKKTDTPANKPADDSQDNGGENNENKEKPEDSAKPADTENKPGNTEKPDNTDTADKDSNTENGSQNPSEPEQGKDETGTDKNEKPSQEGTENKPDSSQDETKEEDSSKDETGTDKKDEDTGTKPQNPSDNEQNSNQTPVPVITKVNVSYKSLTDQKEIKQMTTSETDKFKTVADYVQQLEKGINGYNYVKYEYAVDETTHTVNITLYYEVKDKYSVSVNYYLEGTSTPIHFSNVRTNLTEGESYDVSKFNAIAIKGYTYVKTDGELKGIAKGKDQVININCYYKKNDNSNVVDTTIKPEKGETISTSSQTNQGLYIGLAAAAVAAIGVIAFLLLRKKK